MTSVCPSVFAVTLPKNLQILPVSPSKPSRRSMQSPYRLPNPLPPLPVRKGVRGRRPKSETIALLKAVAEAAAAQNGTVPENTQLVPRPHKKRGPKPGSKVSGPQRRPSRYVRITCSKCVYVEMCFFSESPGFSTAPPSCPASRSLRRGPPVSALSSQPVTTVPT